MNEELKVIISAEIDKLRKDLDTGRKQLQNFEKQGTNMGQKLGKAMGTMGKATATAFKAVGAAAVAGVAAMVGLSEATADYAKGQAKLKSAFQSVGSTVEQATETYNDLYRVLGDSDVAVEAAGHLAKLTTNQEDLAEWSNICQGVYATFGDSIPIESLTEAANETAKTGEITGALADALNWAGVNEDEFADKLFWCNTEAEREALIRETLTGLYGDAAAAYEENAASLLAANEAQAALTASLAALGEVVRPIVTIFKDELAVTLQDLVPHLGLVAEGLKAIMDGDASGAEQMAAGISGVLNTLVNKITELLPTALTIGVQIISSLIQGILQATPAILESVIMAANLILAELPKLIGLVLELLPSLIDMVCKMLISLTPSLISAVVDIIVLLCENFDNILKPLIDSLPLIIVAVIDGIMSNLDKLLGGLIELVISVVRNIPIILDSLISSLPLVISMVIDGLLSCLPQLILGLLTIAIEVAKAIPSVLDSVIIAAVNVLAGIWDGLSKVFGKVDKWFKDKFSGAVSGIKNAFSGFVGFFSGIWENIKSIFSKVGSAIGNAITSTVKSAVNGVLSSAIKIINGFISAINTAISVINAIPGVNISKLNSLSVPKLARGGVIDTATIAMIGESGKEAVVPLENNTEWLDMLTNRLVNAIGGSNKPIYLQIDGKTFGQISAESINDITRQSGRIPLIFA